MVSSSLYLRLRLFYKWENLSKIDWFNNQIKHTIILWTAIVTFRGLALHRKKPVKHCLNAHTKMTSDKFDDERLLARKTNENKMKNGLTLIYSI